MSLDCCKKAVVQGDDAHVGSNPGRDWTPRPFGFEDNSNCADETLGMLHFSPNISGDLVFFYGIKSLQLRPQDDVVIYPGGKCLFKGCVSHASGIAGE